MDNNFTYNENNSKILNCLNDSHSEKRLNEIINVANNTPILNLVVLSSNYYKIGKHFKIGPFGIINKHNKIYLNKDTKNKYINNNKQKGIVYFGYYPYKINKQLLLENNYNKKNKNNKNLKYYENNKVIFDNIDIQIPPLEGQKENNKNKLLSTFRNNNQNNNSSLSNILENKKYGIYFSIYFNPNYIKYYIKDYRMSSRTFIKIQNEIILKNNYLINIGDTYLEISIGLENKTFLNEEEINMSKLENNIFSFSDSEYNNNLNLKIISKDKIYDPVNFLPTKSKIKIGRASNCEIVIDDILLSRIHCTIEYKNNIGWIIRDGYNKKENLEETIDNKCSTNGTWLYVLEDTPIYEGMILRCDNNLFRCKF